MRPLLMIGSPENQRITANAARLSGLSGSSAHVQEGRKRRRSASAGQPRVLAAAQAQRL
jgi:hypothetical protein